MDITMQPISPVSAFMRKLDARWYVVMAIVLMGALAVKSEGWIVLSHVVSICLISSILDFIIIGLRDRKIVFPLSAFVSGLIISCVLAPTRLFYIAPIAAIFSKHIIRLSSKHIFNPAGFGLLVANVFFGLPLSWWLATNWVLIMIFGLFIAYRIRKFSLIFSFMLSVFILSIGYSLLRHQPLLANALSINPFFVFFMLPEPKTSPLYLKSKLIYGAIVSFFVILSFAILPRYDFNILGLIAGNIVGVFLKKVK